MKPADDDAPLAGYRRPPQVVWHKQIARIVGHCRAFIALSPWARRATVDRFPDVSPGGGAPCFVEVLDERRLALPDRPGSERIDSLRNVLGRGWRSCPSCPASSRRCASSAPRRS